MSELEHYRQMVDHALIVSSGMRCKAHNDTIPNAASNSWHLYGKAADLLWIPDKFMMLHIALAVFDGIGIGRTFLHVDLGGVQKLWIY